MSTEDPTYEEVWREFHNFTYQTLPNLERLKAPLKKAADIEKFLQSSASTVADQQASIDRMATLVEQRRTELEKANADLDKAKVTHQQALATYRAEQTALTQQTSEIAARLEIARASAHNETTELASQRAELQTAVTKLLQEIDSKQHVLDGIRERIAAAAAALK